MGRRTCIRFPSDEHKQQHENRRRYNGRGVRSGSAPMRCVDRNRKEQARQKRIKRDDRESYQINSADSRQRQQKASERLRITDRVPRISGKPVSQEFRQNPDERQKYERPQIEFLKKIGRQSGEDRRKYSDISAYADQQRVRKPWRKPAIIDRRIRQPPNRSDKKDRPKNPAGDHRPHRRLPLSVDREHKRQQADPRQKIKFKVRERKDQ